MSLKQSICYPIFLPPDAGLKDLCRFASETGFAAIEMWERTDRFEEIVSTAKEFGLSIASMSGHQSLTDGLNDPANHSRIADELHESIDIAAINNIPGLICFSGNRRDGQSDGRGAEVCAKGLAAAIPYAEENGINLNLEVLNSKVDHPGYLGDRTKWGVSVCRMADSPRAKLLYDVYHMQIMEGDVIRTIRDNINLIGHFHTAGNPGRNDLDDSQELNYRAISKAIAETGYDLFVGHEYIPVGDPFDSFRRTFEICNQQ
jgi:hydroxypyruvate isomerase